MDEVVLLRGPQSKLSLSLAQLHIVASVSCLYRQTATCQGTRDSSRQKLANFFCKRPDSKYFRLCGSCRSWSHVLCFQNTFLASR